MLCGYSRPLSLCNYIRKTAPPPHISHPVGFAHRHPNGLCKGQHVLRPINSTMDFPELVYDGFCKDRRQMSLCVITLLFWDLKRLK